MTTLRLWPEEFEALRAEARAAVEAGLELFGDLRSADEASMTTDERVAFARERLAKNVFPSPDAIARDIAGVPCRIFTPDGPPRAVYLHFHGGGMVSGTPAMMDIPNQMLAHAHSVAVVSADYRKAPEHPWPAGPDDGVAVARWLVDNAQAEFGSARLLLGGESAGGYMAAITALRIRDELGAIDRVDGCNLVFGVYDWGRSPSQRGIRPHEGPDVLSPDGIAFFTDCFLPGRSDDERRAPQISPAYADLRGLPPCLVSVGSTDHLLDDSLMFASRAAAAGVDVDLFVAPDMPHAFFAFDCGITKRWNETVADWFEARLTP